MGNRVYTHSEEDKYHVYFTIVGLLVVQRVCQILGCIPTLAQGTVLTLMNLGMDP